MPAEPAVLSESSALAALLLTLLTPLSAAGLALINAGLNRSRSAAHAMVGSISALAVAIIAYFAFGFSVQAPGGHTFTIGGKLWNWMGSGPFFLAGLHLNDSLAALLLWQMFAVMLAALIPVASGAERWRISASCLSSALLSAWTYPLFAHWVWGSGWLAQLGSNYGIGRGFLDPGGAASIQAVGGLTALSIAWILGPRSGKFTADGMPTAMPGHNAVLVLFGCMLALPGWLGLNASGAVLFVGAAPLELAAVAVNTLLCAAAAVLATLSITRVRFGKPDASLSANGWIAGLVSSSACCHLVSPAEAVIIGLVAGALVIFSVEIFELRMGLDDPAGAISVHAVSALWGMLALGMFGRGYAGEPGQFLAQLIGAATLVGFVLPLSYGLNYALNRVLPLRVSPEGERQGMDLHELGAGAYPDFVTQRDEYMRR